MEHKTKIQMKTAFQKARGNKKEIFRLLTIAEKLGLEWGSRAMYGGGTSIEVVDKYDPAILITIYKGEMELSFDEDYFSKDFKPSRLVTYSEEQLADIRNEEALYGYEMPHYKIVKG